MLLYICLPKNKRVGESQFGTRVRKYWYVFMLCYSCLALYNLAAHDWTKCWKRASSTVPCQHPLFTLLCLFIEEGKQWTNELANANDLFSFPQLLFSCNTKHYSWNHSLVFHLSYFLSFAVFISSSHPAEYSCINILNLPSELCQPLVHAWITDYNI